MCLLNVIILAFYNFGCCFLELFPLVLGYLLYKSSRNPKLTHSGKCFNFTLVMTIIKCAIMFIFSVFFVATFGQYRNLRFGGVFLRNGPLYLGIGSFVLIISILIQFFQLLAAVYIKIFKDQADGEIKKALPQNNLTEKDTSQLDKSNVMNASQVDLSKMQLAPNLNVTSSHIVLGIDNETSFSK